MEPEVHIIEKYFQEILHCFTMTNIRCKGGKEIDLLAIDPKTLEKYHVESRVGTSPSFKIRLQDTYTKNGRAHKIGIDYFAKEKFNHALVEEKIKEIFGNLGYRKILIVWHVKDSSVIKEAYEKFGIEIQFLGFYLDQLISLGQIKGSRDDVLRTIEFISIHEKIREKTLIKISKREKMKANK